MAIDISDLFVDELVGAVVPTLKDAAIPFKAFSMDVSSQLKTKGETVKVPVIGVSTSAEYDASSNNYEDANTTDVPTTDVTLASHYKSTGSLTDIQSNKTVVDVWAPTLNEQIYANANKALADLMDVMTPTNFTHAAGYTGSYENFDSDSVVECKIACDVAKVPKPNRSMILSSEYLGGLLKDGSLKDISQSGSAEALRQGTITNTVANFRMFDTNIIPDNSVNLAGWCGHPSSIALATRVVMPQSGSEKVIQHRVITDPETGFSMGVRIHYAAATGTVYMTAEMLWGKSFIRNAGILILSE